MSKKMKATDLWPSGQRFPADKIVWLQDLLAKNNQIHTNMYQPFESPNRRDYEVSFLFGGQDYAFSNLVLILRCEHKNMMQSFLSEAFSTVSLEFGGQTFARLDCKLNALLTILQAKKRLFWYNKTFALLRGSVDIPKLIADTILCYCALQDDDATLVPALISKNIKTCFTFYELWPQHYAQIDLPLCFDLSPTRPLVKPMYYNMLIKIHTSSADLNVPEIAALEAKTVCPEQKIDGRNRNIVLRDVAIWQQVDYSTICSRFVNIPLLYTGSYASCVLFCAENIPSSLEAQNVFETVCLNQCIKTPSSKKWTAADCFLRQIEDKCWFAVPLHNQKIDQTSAILCRDFEKVVETICCTCGNSDWRCCDVSLTFCGALLDTKMSVYVKVWRLFGVQHGVGGFF